MRFKYLHKTFIFYAFAAVAVLFALEIYPPKKINDKTSGQFSAQRVAHDIRIISKEPHSIQQPKERKVLRDYLFYRLQQIGGDTQIIEYDTIEAKIGGKFNYSNIYSVFSPDKILPDTSYILLVAHYDSRYRQRVLKDTVFSFGAADDGYGLGVIIESVYGAIKYRHEWNQGIKVLFTDAEEHDLDGMRSAFNGNPEIFEDVNLVVNLDARGVKGPALLFETSPNNCKVMDLYKYADNPAGFSFTSVVYRFLPNGTDFSVVKDSIPGMNFAVIDNLDYYHTNLDNFSNISLNSIHHYGEQIVPVLYEYLTNGEYSAKDAFKGDSDAVFFAFPVIGMMIFSKMEYIVANLAVWLLLALVLFIYFVYNRFKFKDLAKCLGWVALFAAGAFVCGTLAAYIASLHTGIEYSFVDLKYIPYADTLTLTMCGILIVWILIFCRLHEKKDKYYPYKMALGTNLFLFILSFVLLVLFGENFFVLLPLATSVLSLFLAISRYLKWVYLLSTTFTIFFAVYFVRLLYLAITSGSLGLDLFLVAIYSFSVISQYYCYKRRLM